MSAALRIVRAGPGATLQDAGRMGFLRFGVTPAGPMDWAAFRIANLLAGNAEGAAAIEISIGGMEIEPEGRPLPTGATVVEPGPPFEAELPPGMLSPPPPDWLFGSDPLPWPAGDGPLPMSWLP